MGKSKKKADKIQQARSIQNKDAFMRMNFLLQAATIYSTIPVPSPAPATAAPATLTPISISVTNTNNNTDTPTTDATAQQQRMLQRKIPKDIIRNTHTLVNVGRFYAKSMKTVASRLVLRLDPQIKRTICKRCDAILIPGVTSAFYTSKNGELKTVIKCRACGETKNLPCRKDHVLFTERPDVLVPEDQVS
ncbi:Ribonuclease P protein subunit p21 [Chytridiales sp. JEL 0842]|nr:Ribonuclease P protein subunit p21 [Chytridiales sp. JEL 0842]